jgi:hypothetical protein
LCEAPIGPFRQKVPEPFFRAKRCRSWLVGTCILGLAIFSGCSAEDGTFPTGEVTGTVAYKGQRISMGKITFISTGREGYFGSDIINDGFYTVKAPLGPCKVEIQMQSDENKYAVSPQQMKMIKSKLKAMKKQGLKVPDEPPQATKKTTFDLPEKYKFADKSGLEFDVKEGTQTKEWDLR